MKEDDFITFDMNQTDNGIYETVDTSTDPDPDVLLFADEPVNDINEANKEDGGRYSLDNNQTFNTAENYRVKNKADNPLRKTIVKIVILCTMLSAALGLGGGYIGYTIAQRTSNGGPEVLYQAVSRTSTDGVSGPLSVSDIAAITADSVVAITTETAATGNRMQQYIMKGAGSGVVITSTGYIVTNNHVIKGANKISVTLNNGKTYDAVLVGADQTTDIAVIKIDANDLKPIVLGDSSKLLVGELAVAIGNPLGQLGGTVTSGIISALDREITIDGETMTLLQTNAAINPGNSGGGLFNAQGELIGIVNAKSSGTGVEGLGFAIPINTVKPVLEQLISNGYVKGKVEMGVTLSDTDKGVYIAKVEKNSNADKAGIIKGDYLLSIKDTEISTVADVKSVLNTLSVGDNVKVVILRDNKQLTLMMNIAEITSNE